MNQGKRMLILLVFIADAAASVYCQPFLGNDDFPYEVIMEAFQIPELPGLHSYGFGQDGDRWLLIGGRTDGLHTRQPFRSFPADDNNDRIYVVDSKTLMVWSVGLTQFAPGFADQLQSTNICHYQDGNILYLAGGYGFSSESGGYITYPYLIIVDVPAAIRAIIAGDSPVSAFRRIRDGYFAISGGQLAKIGDEFHLVGGHRFDGRYNAGGGRSYTQEYSNQVRKFRVSDEGTTPVITKTGVITDPEHLHRRDYNLVPQIFGDGTYGYMISAGVFKPDADLPYLYPVEVSAEGIRPRLDFLQYLSHYHSAKAAIYETDTGRVHSIFFGGISQYFLDGEELKQDDQVPFVRTISRVTRFADGTLQEYQLPISMPGLRGASAEFIPNRELLRKGEKIFRLDSDQGVQQPVLLGYIFGGIISPEANPFSNNRSEVTAADETIYAVWIRRL